MSIIRRLFALLIFIAISPFLLAVSVLILVTSGSPVLFIQKRSGKAKRTFLMYKFRTMEKNAEKVKYKYRHLNEADGPVFKIRNDPRYTKAGRILSHLGLDEIPQLINIIKGEMDFVGPRPLPISEALKIPKKYEMRFSTLPGVTSPWILEGAHNLTFGKWMELDVRYVKEKNIIKDLEIFVKTMFYIIKLIRNKCLNQSGR